MGIRLQKHQRLALEAAREAVEPHGCTARVDETRPGTHLRLVVELEGRPIGFTMLASSPKNRDHMVVSVVKAVRRMAGQAR